MESIILLNSNENTRQVEDEEKSRFVRDVLNSLGIDIEGIWDEDGNLSIENKIKLRKLLSTFNIDIVAEPGGNLQIYHENTYLIGEWKKPQYVLKKDLSQKDPRKRLYVEMRTNYWSVFEENNEQ